MHSPIAHTPRSAAECRRKSRIRSLAVVLATGLTALSWNAGTYAQGVDPKEGRELFGQPSAKPRKKDGKAPDPKTAWTILIEAFRGEEGQRRAEQTLARIQTEGNLRDAYLERRGETWVIAYGRYVSPEDPAALADLERIKGIRIGEGLPYAAARLTPPLLAGTIPEYDLRNAKKHFGPDAAYTLQIGVYSREDKKLPSPAELTDIRRAAEEAAITLRREGDQAFYYHGPMRSTVTVGLFTEDDYDANQQSARLKQVRERYPYNLLNGKGIRRKMTMTTPSGQKTQVERIDPSMLVRVPEGE
jgi:hypothetical protein